MSKSPHSQIAKCSVSQRPVCRRAFNINLALGYTEEVYCLPSLAKIYSKSTEEMFDFAWDYIQARECFRKEWRKMQDPSECPLKEDCVFEKCFKMKTHE